MTRDDVIKTRLRAGRPAPTPLFTARVRQTLARLPQRKKNNMLHYLPVPAIIFAAVVALCLAAVHYNGPGLPWANNNAPAAGGGDTALATTDNATPEPTAMPTPSPLDEQTGEPTPMPEQTAQHTPAPTPMPSGEQAPAPTPAAQFLQPVNVSYTDNGITATVLEAGTDGYVLYLKIKAGPFVEYTDPGIKMKVTIDGIEHNGIRQDHWQNPWKGDSAAGYITFAEAIPLTCEVKGDAVRIDLADDFMVYDDVFVEEGEDESARESKKVSLKISFDLPVSKPDKLAATGSGQVAYGNEASLKGVYRSGDCTTYVLEIEDNGTGDINKYYDEKKGANADPNSRVFFDPENPRKFGITLCHGMVDKAYIESFSCYEVLNLVISAGEKLDHDVFNRNIMMLEQTESGRFLLYIINLDKANRNFLPDGDVTIFTKNHSSGVSGTNSKDFTANHAFHVKVE